MFEWTFEYTISQIFVIIVYLFICITYFLKDRRKILIINIGAYVFQILSFILLNGLTGVAMTCVYIVRNTFFAIDERNRKNNTLNKRDYIILSVFIIIIIILSILTYNGLGSLLSVLAAILSTIAFWQKNTKYYKLLGIPISLSWLGYFIFLKSILAIILESILFICATSGYLIEKRKGDKNENSSV